MADHHDTHLPSTADSGDGLSHEDIILHDKEVDFRRLVWGTVWLMVLMFASLISMWWMIDVMKQGEIDGDPPATAMAEELRDLPVRGPKLQEFPPTVDIEKLHAWEHEQLTTYGDSLGGEGTVRIPVEDAIEILARRGLPRHGDADAAGEEIFGGLGAAGGSRPPEGDGP